jgi:hypothetical protein
MLFAAATEGGKEICLQPVVPYVGMIFNDLEVANKSTMTMHSSLASAFA